MQHSELINKLQQIGFKEYESKVFLVLLKGSALSASEIAKKADIRRSSVYEILKSFAARGFCNEIETNTILKYEIIDPRIISDKIEREIKLINENKISNLKDTFKEFEKLHKTEESAENNNVNIELIRGFNKHRQEKFIELFKAAKEEILFMIRLEGYISEELDLSAENFIKKGGVIKSIYESSLNFKIIKDDSRQDAKLEDLLGICKRFEKSGEQVRISKAILPNITIFDRKSVFINIQDKNVPRHNNADIIINNEDFAYRMIDLFYHYWEDSYGINEFKISNTKTLHKKYIKESKLILTTRR
ncbi:MAG TPA: helix-turn-helix domain-containing protein [Ignavibacteria bacterium]|nr:helix-turn-helix domain-containing protein [Ignavibacteria bacterium]